MKLSLPPSASFSGHLRSLHVVWTPPHRLTWHHGSRFSGTSPKIRMRCTTTSESMELASCWSWVSDDDDDKLSSFINIFIPSMTFTTCFLCTTAKPVVRSLLSFQTPTALDVNEICRQAALCMSAWSLSTNLQQLHYSASSSPLSPFTLAYLPTSMEMIAWSE